MWIINVNGTVVLVVERASMLGRLELTLVLMSKIVERKSVIFSLPISFSICFGCKMEKRNSQLEHGQPKEQKRGLFSMCNSGVACCQSQHQYHFWGMSSMFQVYYSDK